LHRLLRIFTGPALAAAGILVLGAVAIGGGTAAHALTNCTVSDSAVALDSQETAFLGLINSYRASNGLAALTLSTNLNRSSAWMANDLGANNYFAHTDSLGRDPSTRAENCGYPSGAGENIAAGTNWDTAQAVFNGWKASPGHNANMLNATYKQIGIARAYTANSTYGWYWVTDFGLVNDGTSGSTGGTTTPPPPANAAATMSSPANGSTLSGSSASFSWTKGSGALEYFLYAGTSAGANNIYGASAGLNTSASVGNLPTNGSTVYVRLWTRFSTGWQFADYTYRASTASTGGGTTTTTGKAAMTSPAPGSTIHAGTATFAWTNSTGAQQYFFYIGTTPGSNNLFGQSMGLSRSVTITGFGQSGTVYIRLWTLLATGWQYNDYAYALAP
jgi:uncharacterized protein YkwD